MNSPSKTFKRLGIVGAAAVVGLVPIGVLTTSAYAAGNVTTGATLSLANSGAGVGTTATDTLAVTSLSTTNEITSITINASGENLTAVSAVQVNGAPVPSTDFTHVTSQVVISGLALQSGTSVAVTLVGATNPASGVVYVSDQTNLDATPVVSNSLPITPGTAAATGTVTGVNPTAFSSAALRAALATPANLGATTAGEQFTVMGSGFSTAPSTLPTGSTAADYIPAVCFYPATTPSTDTLSYVSGTGCEATPSGGTASTTGNLLAVDTVAVASNEVQGAISGLTAGHAYNVVVFNDNNAVYAGASATSSASLVAASSNTAGLNFVPESGIRVIDTRSGMGLPAGALTPGIAYSIPFATFENSAAVPTNVPSSAVDLSLNVTAVGPATAGNLQVWASPTTTGCVANADTTSTVNFQNPNDTSNSTILAATSTDVVCVQDNGAAVNVLMDVTGYGTKSTNAAVGGTQTRILDTRIGSPTETGSIQGALQGGSVYRVQVPTSVAAVGSVVALNVTASAPTSVGNLRVFPEPAAGPPSASGVPNTSVITYIPGTDASSLFVTTVGGSGTSGGYIDLYSDSTGTVNVVIDYVGTFDATTPNVIALGSPSRLMDTRTAGVAAQSTTLVTVPSLTGPGNTTAVVPLGVIGDLGDILPTSVGNLRTFPGGGAIPGTSSINNFPGQTRSTTAVVATNPGTGQISVYSDGSATNFTFDESAYIY